MVLVVVVVKVMVKVVVVLEFGEGAFTHEGLGLALRDL